MTTLYTMQITEAICHKVFFNQLSLTSPTISLHKHCMCSINLFLLENTVLWSYGCVYKCWINWMYLNHVCKYHWSHIEKQFMMEWPIDHTLFNIQLFGSISNWYFLFLLFHLTNYSPLHLNSLYILKIAFGVNSSSKGELELE